MKNPGPKTINVKDVWHFEVQDFHSSGSFVLEVTNRKHKVRFHMEDFFLKHLAAETWKVVNQRKKFLSNVESVLKTGQ